MRIESKTALPDPGVPGLSVTSHLPVSEAALLEALGYFYQLPVRPSPRLASNPVQPVASEVTALIVATKEERFGRAFSLDDLTALRQVVAACIGEQIPVQMYTTWGAIKHYVSDDEQGVDLAEWFALAQFARLRRDIQRIYPAGLALHIYLEDFGVLYEDAGGRGADVHRRVEQNVKTYVSQFEALVDAVAAPWAKAYCFSAVVPADQHTACLKQADVNLELFRAYWRELESSYGRAPESLASFSRLREAGWTGDIPAAMRAHYLRRLNHLYPLAPGADKVDRLLRYFAMVLLYNQRRVFPHLSQPCIKAAMYRAAPGMPTQRLSGRLHVRTLPRHLSTCTAPPWTTKGCFVLRCDGSPAVSLQSFRLLRESGTYLAAGRLRLAGGKISIPADGVLPGGNAATPAMRSA